MICNFMVKSKELSWGKERTLFLNFIGYSVKGRIFDWLLTVRELDFSRTDIVNCSGVNKKEGFKIVEWLIKNNYITPSRKIKNNKVQLYKLNKNKKIINLLINVFDECLKDDIKIRRKK